MRLLTQQLGVNIMAYVSKENKESKAPRLRALAKSYGLTATVAVRHSSTLQLNVSKGKIDFIF